MEAWDNETDRDATFSSCLTASPRQGFLCPARSPLPRPEDPPEAPGMPITRRAHLAQPRFT